MEVKPGYKKTEIGVIPEEWQYLTVGEFIQFQGGSQPDKNFFSATARAGYIRLIQIRDYKSDKYEVFAPVALLRRFCDENDIMIGRYGPPVFQILRGLAGAYNVALIKAIPRSGIDREFAYYFLKQESLFEFIDKLSRRSSGQTGVDLLELRAYPLALPPLPEQRAIAEALGDVDALLAALDRLIAKKHDLKQAAMQQLLTGKTRLPGFKGEWEVKHLSEVSSLKGRIGWQGLKQTEFTWIPERPFLITGMNFKDGAIRWDEVYHISEDRYEIAKDIQLREGDVLMTKDGTIGKILYVDHIPFPGKASLNSHLLLFRPIGRSYDPRFLYFQLNSKRFKDFIELSKSGTTFFGISQSAVAKYEVLLPPLPEQTAIATVLSDMDAELTALEQRREKTRALKQGMMQELLTGKTRLA